MNGKTQEESPAFLKLYIPHLAYRLRDDINPDQIPLGIAGKKKKPGRLDSYAKVDPIKVSPSLKVTSTFFPDI